MTKLRLAVDNADLVSNSFRRKIWLDVATSAHELARAHPEAHSSIADIEDTLRENNWSERGGV